MKTLAERLREREKALGVSQAYVAKAAGLSAKRYSHYVTGRSRPNYENLIRICRVLKTSPNYLLGFEANLRTEIEEELVEIARGLDDLHIKTLINVANGFIKSK